MDICQILNSAVKLTAIWKGDNTEVICLLILVKAAGAMNLVPAQSFHGLDAVIAARSDVPGPALWRRQDFHDTCKLAT